MKSNLLLFLFLALSITLHAQLEKKYNSNSTDIPQWAQIMYAENADIGEVMQAYETYYKTHEFVKTGHTQYYKRWLRTIKRDINGFTSKTNDWRTAQELNEEYQQKLATRSPTSPWTCIGPFDFDKGSVDRSYAAGAAHIYTLEQSISNTDVLYAGSATAGVWKSIDKGLNWTLVTKNMLVNGVIAVEIDHTNENIAYFEGGGILYKTTNGGTSWTATGDATFQNSGHELTDIVMHPTNNQIIFLCANDGLYRTDDAGANFTKLKGGEYQELEFHPTNNNILYAIKEIDNRTEFYKSTDGGTTFNLTGTGWPGIASTATASFSSVNMDDTGDYLTAASNINPGDGALADFTIEMRIKSPSWSGDPAFFSNKNWNNGTNVGFVLACRANQEDWKFNISDGTTRIDLNGGIIDDGEWHHIAVSYDADGTKSVYQDGVLLNTSNVILANSVATALSLALGQDGTLTYGDDFNGNINEIRIWNSVLSATDIDDYKCQIVDNTHPQYANLAHHWKMEENGGTTLADAIAGNTLTANGTTTWNTSESMTCVTPDLISPDEQKRTEIATTPAAPGKVFALCTGSANGGSGLYGIYISDDEGGTWTRTCCGPQPAGAPSATNQNLMAWSDEGTDDGGQYYYDVAFDVSDTNADDIYVGGVNLWISRDGGNTFTCPSKWSHSEKTNYVHADLHDIRFFGSDIWVSNDGGVFYSNDEGASFTRRMLGIAGTDFWGFGAGFWDGDVMVGGTYHNGTLLKDNNVYENGWVSTGGGDNTLGKVNYADERKVYYDYGERMLSGDRMIANAGLPFNKDLWSRPFAFDPRSANNIYVGLDGDLWFTEDDGVSFDLVNTFAINIHKIETAWNDPETIYVTLAGGWWDKKEVWKTNDGGTTWTDITPTLAEIGSRDWVRYDITVDGEDADIVWLSRIYPYSGSDLDGYQVLKSTNGGSSWSSISTPTLDGESAVNITHQRGSDGGVYIGTKRAVYYKNNTMPDWALFNTDLPASTYSTDLIPFYKEGKIRNGTNRSVYEAELYENTPPLAQISLDRFESFCNRDTIYFSDHSALNQNGVSWAWTFPGGVPATSTDRQPKVTYILPGTYSASLTVTDAYGNSSQTLTDIITITAECEADTIPGYAMQSTTNSDYASIPNMDITTNEITFSAWVKPNGIQPEYTGIVFNDGTSAGLNFRPNNQLAYHWPGGSWSWNSGLFVPVDEWSHVALVATPTSLTVYLNGVAATHTTNLDPVLFETMKIGRYKTWSSRNYTGLIDEVCIYDRSLSQAEIRELRHLTKKPSEDASLIAYYQFNRDEGKVTDRSKINHATLQGGATRVISTAPVGGGSSQRMTINSAGIADFTAADVSIDFGTTHPDGEVVVSRINLNPDESPAASPISRSYWIVNNYGNNTTFTALNSIQFDKIGYVSASDVTIPTTFKLYKRNSNDDGATWGTSLDDGDLATAGTDGNVTFSTGNGLTSFSQFIVTNEGTSLPVELLSFTATLQEKREVLLEWTTISEVNSDYFNIERSKDGVNFEWIGKVAAAGNSSEEQRYILLDKEPYSGKSYYRLQQVDIDESYEYSAIRQIFIGGNHSDIIIYPNPANKWVRVITNFQETAQFVLFDAKGKQVMQRELEEDTTINTDHLPSGSYMYRVIGGGKMLNGVIVVQ